MRIFSFVLVWAAAALFTGVMFAQTEITIPLEGGSILIENPQFLILNSLGATLPELSVKITNQTLSSWSIVKLRFDIGGICSDGARQWSGHG